MTPLPLHRSFAPIVNGETRLLLLGSLPGAVSLAEQRYYAHPRNHFWRLIGAVIGEDLADLPYEARLDTLLAAGVGLWDTVGAGQREGSLDANIRLHEANDLEKLAAALPHLRGVGFNGAKAASLGRRQLAGRTDLRLVDLPSSSPAYTLAFERKRDAWLALRTLLEPLIRP